MPVLCCSSLGSTSKTHLGSRWHSDTSYTCWLRLLSRSQFDSRPACALLSPLGFQGECSCLQSNSNAKFPDYLYFNSYHYDYDLAHEQEIGSDNFTGFPDVMIQNQIDATAGDPLSRAPPPPPYALPENPALRLLCLDENNPTLTINRDIATLLPKESIYVGAPSPPCTA